MTLLQYGQLKSKLTGGQIYDIISLVEKLRRWLSLRGGGAYESKHQNLQRGDACLSVYQALSLMIAFAILVLKLNDKNKK